MLLTGRFSGHLDRDDQMQEHFEDLDADSAIAWGRRRAAVVLIRTGDSDYYSAGEHNPDLQEFPPWPPAGVRLERRRAKGFEALDNTEADAPVLWDVRVQANLPGQQDPNPFHERIRAHPDALDVHAPAPGYPAVSAAFLVEAATEQQARELAEAIHEEAFETLVHALPPSVLGAFFTRGAEVYPHRPGESVRGPGIVY